MSAPFPKAPRSERGYDRAQVDQLLAQARSAYEAGSTGFSARDLREASFDLVKGGYRIAAVDAALERLEDTFASRDRERRVAELGQEAVLAQARNEALELVSRLRRGPGKRFRRSGPLRQGYHRKEVDAFAERLMRYFEGRGALTPAEVRSAAFRAQSNGYAEPQVDAFLDAVIEVLLTVQPSGAAS